jgi:hypothetical protein
VAAARTSLRRARPTQPRRRARPQRRPPPASADEKHARLASAVVDSKTTAPVDMKYDVLSKPALGQPFEVEMTFDTRLPADTLETEIVDAPGLTIVGEKTASYASVEGGKSYTSKVLVKGDNPGLFYIGVVAKMATKVQTETRAFAIPVVIGDPPPRRSRPRRRTQRARRSSRFRRRSRVASRCPHGVHVARLHGRSRVAREWLAAAGAACLSDLRVSRAS